MGVLLEDPCLLNCSLPVPLDVAGGTTTAAAATASSLSFSRLTRGENA